MAQGIKHKPTQADRDTAKRLSALGCPHEDIAIRLKISADTLVKYYQTELMKAGLTLTQPLRVRYSSRPKTAIQLRLSFGLRLGPDGKKLTAMRLLALMGVTWWLNGQRNNPALCATTVF